MAKFKYFDEIPCYSVLGKLSISTNLTCTPHRAQAADANSPAWRNNRQKGRKTAAGNARLDCRPDLSPPCKSLKTTNPRPKTAQGDDSEKLLKRVWFKNGHFGVTRACRFRPVLIGNSRVQCRAEGGLPPPFGQARRG